MIWNSTYTSVGPEERCTAVCFLLMDSKARNNCAWVWNGDHSCFLYAKREETQVGYHVFSHTQSLTLYKGIYSFVHLLEVRDGEHITYQLCCIIWQQAPAFACKAEPSATEKAFLKIGMKSTARQTGNNFFKSSAFCCSPQHARGTTPASP